MDDMHKRSEELQQKAKGVADHIKNDLHEAHGKADQWMKERKNDVQDALEERE